MTSYKFLAKGAIGPLSGHVWPEPGRWLEASGPLVVCSRGIHVCRPEDLAHWLHDELWQVDEQRSEHEARESDQGANEARACLALLHVAAGLRPKPVPQRQQPLDYAARIFLDRTDNRSHE